MDRTVRVKQQVTVVLAAMEAHLSGEETAKFVKKFVESYKASSLGTDFVYDDVVDSFLSTDGTYKTDIIVSLHDFLHGLKRQLGKAELQILSDEAVELLVEDGFNKNNTLLLSGRNTDEASVLIEPSKRQVVLNGWTNIRELHALLIIKYVMDF